MATPTFCIEITGEGLIHPFFNQSGFSGKDYKFFKNRSSRSYVRAYAEFKDYLAERDDMHTVRGVWALKANFYPSDQIDDECFIGGRPKDQNEQSPEKRRFSAVELRSLHHKTLRKIARDQGVDDQQSTELIIAELLSAV